VVGDPDWLWRWLPHPAAIIGRAIARLDASLNDTSWSPERRRFAGMFAMVLLVVGAVVVGWSIGGLTTKVWYGWLPQAVVASIFLAQRSLYQHVRRVPAAFATGGLAGARQAVSAIVGRDPAALDEAAVCRAAIETTAESFCDGVVAPAFWLALLGLPGLIACKAINTADSMIGHLTERHRDFGWAAARLDDLVNWVPARVSGVLLALVSPATAGSIPHSLGVMWADARHHRSPNAGWPESAMGAALGLALGGPRSYDGDMVDDPFLNAAGRAGATPDDISRSLKLFISACLLQFVLYGVLAFLA